MLLIRRLAWCLTLCPVAEYHSLNGIYAYWPNRDRQGRVTLRGEGSDTEALLAEE